LRHQLLAMCRIGLVLLAAVDLWGIAESARVLMLPLVVFLAAIYGVIVVGLVRSHPAAVAGIAQSARISEALGVILVLKAFAAGCSALTGIEAIANGVRSPPSDNRVPGAPSAPSCCLVRCSGRC
jgi:amino acid transporter